MAHCRRPRPLSILRGPPPPLRNFTSTRSTCLLSLERKRKRNLERDRTIAGQREGERETERGEDLSSFSFYEWKNDDDDDDDDDDTVRYRIFKRRNGKKGVGFRLKEGSEGEGKRPSLIARAKISRDKWRARFYARFLLSFEESMKIHTVARRKYPSFKMDGFRWI